MKNMALVMIIPNSNKEFNQTLLPMAFRGISPADAL